ncbi:MAG: DJ-1/PfpI family protein [Lachnospiraceae bacterium]|nr:DJ-1/PfpI family protein [Lachnospiraceae bacterium]
MAKAAIFLAEGFETVEALAVVDLCRRAGVELDTVSITEEKRVVSSQSIPVEADKVMAQAELDSYDMLILPGGMPGTVNLENCEALMQKLDEFNEKGKNLSAICAAPRIFGKRGFLKGRKATCYPGAEVFLEGADHTGSALEIDGHFITSRGMGTATQFGLAIVERLMGADTAREVAEKITFEGQG